MQNQQSREQFLVQAILANTDPELQLKLLRLVLRLKALPDGYHQWRDLWIEARYGEKGKVNPDLIRCHKKAEIGLELGHPVTWPKEAETELQIVVGPKPNDSVYYTYFVQLPCPTSEEPGFYFEQLAAYFLIWYIQRPDSGEPPSGDGPTSQSSSNSLSQTDKMRIFRTILDGLIAGSSGQKRNEEIVRYAKGLQRALGRR